MNLRELLDELNIPFHEAGASQYVTEGWIGILCPWCGRGNKFGLGINLQSLRASCWKCGPHRLGEALALASGKPLRDVLAKLPGVFADVGPNERASTGRYEPPPDVGPLQGAHRAYLTDRGFNPDQVEKDWGIQGIGLSCPQFMWRLFIPVIQRGKTLSWTTRAIGKKVSLRYRAARPDQEAEPIHDCVYGIDKCKHTVLIVEGPADVWRLGPGGAGLFGVKFTPAQVVQLSRFPTRVVCFDDEPEAQRQAAKLCDCLASFPGVTYQAVLRGSKDPDAAPPDELDELRRRFLE